MPFKRIFYIHFLVFASVAIGNTSACSAADLVHCILPLEMMSNSQLANLHTTCPVVHKMIDCFDQEVKKCHFPPDLINNFRQHFSRWQAMCTANDGDTNDGQDICSSKDLLACVEPLNSVRGQVDMAMACLTIHNSIECVQKEFDTCPKHLQTYLVSARQQLDQARKACDPYKMPPETTPGVLTTSQSHQTQTSKPAEVSSSKPPCHWSTVRDCVWPLDQLVSSPYHSDRMMMCQMYDKAAKCLEKEKAQCPGYMPVHMWSAQMSVDRASTLCGQTKTTQPPEHAGQHAACVNDNVMKMCLIHNQWPESGKTRKEPLGRKDVCLMVGKSASCIQHQTRKHPSCSPSLVTMMTKQLQDQRAQCKELGYPTNQAVKLMQPTPILTLLVASVSAILHHIL